MNCKTCERRKGNRCSVFKSKPDNCWAWTDDKDWAEKVAKAVAKYKEVRQ